MVFKRSQCLAQMCTNNIKLKFVCLNALISGTTGSNRKIISVLDSPFIEEG